MPVLPAFGGKLNSTSATLRAAVGVWRRSIRRSTRAASALARSGCGCISREWSDGASAERPPKTIGPVEPSSSGMATIIVASTGISPRSEDCHCSSV